MCQRYQVNMVLGYSDQSYAEEKLLDLVEVVYTKVYDFPLWIQGSCIHETMYDVICGYNISWCG